MDTLASELASLAKDSHLAIAARQREDSPAADLASTGVPNTGPPKNPIEPTADLPNASLPSTGLPRNPIEEKPPLEVYPTSRSRPGTAPSPKP